MQEIQLEYKFMDARGERPIPAGEEVLDGWKVEGLLNKGGFGSVYKIVKTIAGIGMDSAMKVISVPANPADISVLRSEGNSELSITTDLEHSVRRAVNEIRTMVALRNRKNVVRCEDFTVIRYDEDGTWDIMIRMELLQPLEDYVEARSKQGGMSQEEILTLAIDLSDLIGYCGEKGILHRDIKPPNIFYDEANGLFKLGDFGLARASGKTNSYHTRGVGTETWMAPDVRLSEDYGTEVDVYSLGLVLYWLLNKRRIPFVDRMMGSKATAARLAGNPIPPPSDADEALSEIVLKSLAFKKEDRYPNGYALRDALIAYRDRSRQAVQPEPQPPQPIHEEPKPPKPVREKPVQQVPVQPEPQSSRPAPEKPPEVSVQGGSQFDFQQLDERTCLVKRYNGLDQEVAIPPTDNRGRLVTMIGIAAFSGCRRITSVSMPSTVKVIGDTAFKNCTSMRSIRLSNATTSIGMRAFEGCGSLKEIVLNDRVKSIGPSAFAGCNQLTIYGNPNSVAEQYARDNRLAFRARTARVKGPETEKERNAAPSGKPAEGNQTEPVYLTFKPLDAQTCEVSGYRGAGAVTVPDKSDRGSRVVRIGKGAFQKTRITEVMMAEGITSIQDSAFSECAQLQQAEMPQGLTEIGSMAFHNCIGLREIRLRDSLRIIGSSAFLGCSALQQISLPESIQAIGRSAFEDCAGLRRIKLPPKLKIISSSLFKGCSALSLVVIPEGVTTIESFAFMNCPSLRQIRIPDSVTRLGDSIFQCGSRTDLTVLSNNATVAAYCARNKITCLAVASSDATKRTANTGAPARPQDWDFEAVQGSGWALKGYRGREENVEIPASYQGGKVCKIAEGAFRGSRIKSVQIPGAVSVIGAHAFEECNQLTQVSIPGSVGVIERMAFAECAALKSVTLEQGIRSIGESCFFHCKSLQEIRFPSSIIFIGDNAMDGCGALQRAFLPERLTVINSGLFNDCGQLREISVPRTVSEIRNRAFMNCRSLKEILLRSGVRTIGRDVFFCSPASEIVIYAEPGSQAEKYARENRLGWKDLSTYGKQEESESSFKFKIKRDGTCVLIGYDGKDDRVRVPREDNNGHKVTEIGDNAFDACIMSTVTLPNSIQQIGAYAFRGCNRLTTIYLSDHLTRIERDAFAHCERLQNLEIPQSVNWIGEHAFSDCRALKSIRLPGSIQWISERLMQGCTGITSITLPDSVTAIGDEAFSGCASLREILIPSNVTRFGQHLFDGIPWGQLTIRCQLRSPAQKYAKKEKINTAFY